MRSYRYRPPKIPIYVQMPRRVLAAYNCLRGRPTMYRIESHHGGSFDNMNNLFLIENKFIVPEGESGLEMYRVRGGKIIGNRFIGKARPLEEPVE